MWGHAMSGINRRTGGELSGWQHCLQSLVDFWTTPKGSRVMRRDYGGGLLGLIDRPMDRDVVLEAVMAAAEVEDWEPRFRLKQVGIAEANADGKLTLVITGIYFPNGHIGDFSAYEPVDNQLVRIA